MFKMSIANFFRAISIRFTEFLWGDYTQNYTDKHLWTDSFVRSLKSTNDKARRVMNLDIIQRNIASYLSQNTNPNYTNPECINLNLVSCLNIPEEEETQELYEFKNQIFDVVSNGLAIIKYKEDLCVLEDRLSNAGFFFYTQDDIRSSNFRFYVWNDIIHLSVSRPLF